MQFIKVHKNTTKSLFRVNVDHILYYEKTITGTELTFDTESYGVHDYMLVTETPEEIEKMISN